ncbi:PD-(D/E)XK nuclease family protein [Mariprofundus sp. EBB-1]|uniref:PD-(D/E)XK nuclease family protein n=1 Tax=Mariprofundus sp. EBB-1 TaxID=2650971 RepID=UPI0019137AA7|nr:PD-(D/E)XK nuclease family protein [Mariprofundus sp. EBB-1]
MSNQLNLPSIDASDVSASLNAGAVLLTSSSRLALDWKRRLVTERVGLVCETPEVFAWQAWLNALTMDIAAMPVALNRMQERCLWEQTISHDLPEVSTASVRGLAGHAIEAYALMQDFQVDMAELAFGGSEAEALARWIKVMQLHFSDGVYAGRMLSADTGLQLLQHIEQVNQPETILLSGFETYSPLQKRLLSALQSSGCNVMQLKADLPSGATTLFACSDEISEYRHIASRIKTLLEQTPHLRIAVATSAAITDLSALTRELDDVLVPTHRLDPTDMTRSISVSGEALSETPMISQLIHVLGLAGKSSLSFQEFSTLLFSPWLKDYTSERLARAALDAKYRQYNRHSLSLSSLIDSPDVRQLPALQSVIRALMLWDKRSRSANAWVKAVHELLKSTGFVPQGHEDEELRSNRDIRQMNAFRDVLTSLVAVDAVTSNISWTQFLSLLRRACTDVRLVSMAKYSNVEVIPLTQISGLRFDHLLVAALDGESFPPVFRPQPMLPVRVQMKYGMPMSSGAQLFESAQQLWQAVQCAAPCVEISYAKQRDGKELLPSSFVADLEEHTGEAIISLITALPMEGMDDLSVVPLSPEQHVKGGTSIIKNQSSCPFRAFATHRLGIAALGETSPGIEASSKGSLIHLALEYIWQQLQTQATLAALADDAVMELIHAAILHAWNSTYLSVDERTRSFEQKRMSAVLRAWLELELERPDFRVEAIEQSYVMRLPEFAWQGHDVNAGDASERTQFEVNIKADRMDVDASGRRILIDYKTGARQSTSKWLLHASDDGDASAERIEEPQLPQYALAAGLGVDDAVAFARVRSSDMAFEGLCGDDIGIKGIAACDGKRGLPDDWQDVLDDWKMNINVLATEFVEGRCDVSPRNAAACQYCGFEAICRIDEMRVDHALEHIDER